MLHSINTDAYRVGVILAEREISKDNRPFDAFERNCFKYTNIPVVHNIGSIYERYILAKIARKKAYGKKNEYDKVAAVDKYKMCIVGYESCFI